MVESILGEGGIKVIPEQCLVGLRKLCDENDLLLILDEVQCGIGRSGKFFAFEWSGIKPDIVPIAKGIGGGFPIGACLVNQKAASGMKPGTHGSTFGGNPLAMSIGNSVLDIIFEKGFLDNVVKQGNYLQSELIKIRERFPNILEEVRGKGLLRGIKLKVDNVEFLNKLFENKMLAVKASENVIRLLPPLIISKQEVDEAISIIEKVCQSFK
jgi:acetylornithine/N-succinyldiaminopimelate aminotransferase